MYTIINWLTQNVPFPKRGWKYFRKLLHFLNIQNRTYKKKLYNGLYAAVSPVDWVQENVFWYGYYEKNELITWTSFVSPASRVLDVGANIGLYSLAAATRAKVGIIDAFEPVDNIRETMIKNLRMNGVGNVEVHPFAASDTASETPLYLGAEENISMSSLQPHEEFSGKTQMVRTVKLDDYFPGGHFHLVKIDVEGAEMKVLAGMTAIIDRSRPVIFIEGIDKQLKNFGNDIGELYSYFTQRKYRAYLVAAANKLTPAKQGTESYTIVFLPEEQKIPEAIAIN